MRNVFISYSSKDQAFADKLVSELERRGLSCWISSRNIKPGLDYQESIVAALDSAGVVLLLFSQHANESVELPKEMSLASVRRKPIIPARIEDIVPTGALAYQLTNTQFIDLFRNYEKKLNELASYLTDMLQVSVGVTATVATRSDMRRLRTSRLRMPILLTIGVFVTLSIAGYLEFNPLQPSLTSGLGGHTAQTSRVANVTPVGSTPLTAPVVFSDSNCSACPTMVEVRTGPAQGLAISQRHITVREWGRCVFAHGCPALPDGAGDDSSAVTFVSWQDANAYAIWLSSSSGRTFRLPTREEWRAIIIDYQGTSQNGLQGRSELQSAGTVPNDPTKLGIVKGLLQETEGGIADWMGDCVAPEGAKRDDCEVAEAQGYPGDDFVGAIATRQLPSKGQSPSIGFRLVMERGK